MAKAKIQNIQDVIGTDAGDRGMKALIVPGDLYEASKILSALPKGIVLVLSGFPCCVNESPPTETDGPPGTFAIARAAMALGHQVICDGRLQQSRFQCRSREIGSARW
jgi:hypothetical protein